MPSGPLKEDHVCREAFLAAFSTYLGIWALALAASEETVKRATLAVAKQSLVSLDCALLAFLKARLALRKEALKGHDLDSPHCLTLLKSTPFSVGLFGKDAVEDALPESQRLNIEMEELLKSLTRGRTLPRSPRPRGPRLRSLLLHQQQRRAVVGQVGAVGTEEVLAGAHLGVRVLELASHRPRTQVNLAQNTAFEQVRVGGRLATYAEAWRDSLWAYGVIARDSYGSGRELHLLSNCFIRSQHLS